MEESSSRGRITVLPMRAAGLVLAVAISCVVASGSGTAAPPRTLLNYGDSLAVGTGSFLGPYLSGWAVREDARVGRHTDVAVRALRSYGARLPHVVSVSLGANDAPFRREWFRQQVLGVLEIAGTDRCVIWSTVVRPPVRGISYDGFNDVLRELDRESSALRLFDWVALAGANPSWLRRDGVHPTAAGYRARAAAVAQLAKSCA
jgi:lysophospholipase L1-like esterase